MSKFINEEKIKIENVEIAGIQTAMRGMRNPLDSWDKSDSEYVQCFEDGSGYFKIGEADLELARKLIKAGNEHGKFLRHIYIGFDFTVPRYLWSEFDTYGFAPKNSCSTMHTLLLKKRPITLDMFVFHEEELGIMKAIVDELNILRCLYNSEGSTAEQKLEYKRRAKQLLPEGFLQKRTVATNYAQIRNIYHQRKNHQLPEWRVIFREFAENIPWANDLIII